MLPLVYDRPLLFVNALPLGCFTSFAKAIWVPKHLRWQESGKSLTVREHLQNSFYQSNDYDAAGIDVIDLTSLEITAACQEFWHRCNGTWQSESNDELLEQEFWATCLAWPEYSDLHGWRHSEARVGIAWLRSLDAAAPGSSMDINRFDSTQTISQA